MNIDLMRKLDYWLGIPICFLLSLVNIILPGKKTKKINKILFLQISEMGSAVYVYSSIRQAQKRFPDARLYYLIFKEMQEPIRMFNLIPEENILTMRGSSIFAFVRDFLSIILKLRKEKIDVVIDLELFSRVSSIISYLSGAKYRAGFYSFHMEGLYRGNFQTHKVLYNPYKHISLNFLALINSISPPKQKPFLKENLGVEQIEIPKIIVTENEKEKLLEKLKYINPEIKNKQIILLNPNASKLLPLRKWPLENYCKLANKLLQNKDVFLIITGVKDDKPDALAICKYVNYERCIDLTGRTSFRELFSLYSISELIVTNDSGPAHFASMTDIKILALYGPETPVLYGPLSKNATVLYSEFSCSPCVSAYNHRKSPCKNNKCLQAITTEQVYAKVKESLNLK